MSYPADSEQRLTREEQAPYRKAARDEQRYMQTHRKPARGMYNERPGGKVRRKTRGGRR